MFEQLIGSFGNVLGFKIDENTTGEDVRYMSRIMSETIAASGKIRLLIEIEGSLEDFHLRAGRPAGRTKEYNALSPATLPKNDLSRMSLQSTISIRAKLQILYDR